MRNALLKVIECDARRVRIRILKPQLLKHCIFKLLANTDIFLQIQTYKIVQYTKQVTTQACLNYQYPFCSSLSVPWWQSKDILSVP